MAGTGCNHTPPGCWAEPQTSDSSLTEVERAPLPCPPRLCPEDLLHPEAYHQRLLDWLARQT